MDLFTLDWSNLFAPKQSLLEIAVRGTFTYFMLFGVMRFFLKRQTGVIGIADLLLIVLLADAAQNAMAGEYNSITEGTLLVLTIVFWNYFLDWLGFYIPAVERFLRAPPLLLVKDGQMIRRNMRQEMITEEELRSQLRQQGCDDLSTVKRAFIEGDGRISVVRSNGDNTTDNSRNDPRPF